MSRVDCPRPDLWPPTTHIFFFLPPERLLLGWLEEEIPVPLGLLYLLEGPTVEGWRWRSYLIAMVTAAGLEDEEDIALALALFTET